MPDIHGDGRDAMTLSSPNPKPRLPAALATLLTERERQFVIMDIGARGGPEGMWGAFKDVADFINFEPDAEECEKLRRDYRSPRILFHPIAVGRANERRRFYLTKFLQSSSLHPANPAFMNRFPMTTTDVVGEIELETVTLDSFVADNKIGHVDFMKIDAEGADYAILVGAEKMLSAQGVLGAKVEIQFDPAARGTEVFADIDTFMRAKGFRLFDISFVRFPRWTLPYGRLAFIPGTNNNIDVRLRFDYGQILGGDALYFRDPVGELREAREPSLAWNAERLLRLCGLLDAYDYGDCAIEILEAFRDGPLDGIDVDRLIDTLVPPLGNTQLDYAQYRDVSNGARQMQNQVSFHLADWKPPPMKYRPKT